MRAVSPLHSLLLVAGLILGIALLTAVMDFANPVPPKKYQTWRYRITIAVNTPEGSKTGSAVREVENRGQGTGGGGPAMHIRCRAEAVPVDLGPRGVLFAMTSGTGCGDVILRVFKPDNSMRGGLSPASVPGVGGRTTLDKDEILWASNFVAFSDVKNPYSGMYVLPEGFTEAFGEGVSLDSVTIEITNDPVTTGEVEKWLPWINQPEVLQEKLVEAGVWLPSIPPRATRQKTSKLFRKDFIRAY